MAFSLQIKRQITADNLHMQEKDMSALLEARRSHLQDLAATLLPSDHVLTPGELTRIGEDVFFAEHSVQLHREVREENRRSLVSALGILTAYDRAVLAEQLVAISARRGAPIGVADFFARAGAYTRIAYVRNAYTDEAYDAFERELSQPTALFSESYEEACGEVTGGGAGYCILPFRDTNGTYHRATQTLLDAHNLMAVSTITVTDGEDVPMQYALCAPLPISFPSSWEMQIALDGEWGKRIGDLAVTIAHYGHTLGGITYDVDGREIFITVWGNTDPASWLVWLHIFATGHRIKGYYSKTEEHTI